MTKKLKLTRSAVAVSLLALATACGSGASTNNQAASANMQAPPGNASHEAMPTGPFSQAEMQMNERMMAATGANASETWARKMIEHHRGALQMSQILIDGGGEPGYVEMARQTVTKQQREIAELEQMLAAGISGGPGEANPYGQIEQTMHQAMMAANGANLSEAWARKMITHHQGAIDMSEALIRQGGNPLALAMARRIAEDQRREIAHLEAMLRGEAMPAAGAPAAREPSAAPKATQAERPAQRNQATPRPAPRPTPTPPPAPTPTCLPEHRAMGHC